MNERKNLVVIGTGMKGSGKSRLLADRYVNHQPRVVHIDPNDEIAERNPRAVRTMGAGALYDALAVAQRRGARAFNIAATGLQTADVAELLRALVPESGPQDSLARAFGTVALECGEMGMLCAIDDKVGDALAAAIMNARHHGLSLFLATQYPYSLPAAARMNSDEVFFFQQDEPQCLVWARQVVGGWGAEYVRALKDHSFLLYERATGLLYLCDKQRRVVDTMPKNGAGAPPPPARPAPARSHRAPRP